MSDLSDLVRDLVRARVLVAVRACPGITPARAAAVALFKEEDAIIALEQLVELAQVEEVALHDTTSLWYPVAWCVTCGCTELHACEGGCLWSVHPGEDPHVGDFAGVCSRCD